MMIVIAFAIFIIVALVVSTLGMRMWVQPKEAIERVTGVSMEVQEHAPKHPSLVFHELVQRLGNVLPASPKDVSLMQRRLIRAGMRGPNALKIFYGSKVILGAAVPILMSLLVAGSPADASNKFIAVLASVAAGFFGPNEYVNIMGKRRQKQIQRGLANGLDLLVVCVESGLGLDQAILQVSKELEHAHPEICEEFMLVNLELKAGKRRAEALRNLAERTSVDDLKKLVAVLIQADRFGTGVAQSLRAHADYMRVQARQIAEEKAAKLGVKLVFPIFFCILPTLFIVTVGPIAVKIVRELLPMMNGM
ncbi:type II secretion system F family protein [Bryobacter aggregatus]|uniref:type II secretion system F family protein n=1 Tax=Bryobacter aggregatus TaxID=360054 RepID=UPI000690E7AA|nr:type II secretion system F family protein [Bryobacter aggregatus]